MRNPIPFVLLLFNVPFILALQRKGQAVFMETDSSTFPSPLDKVADNFSVQESEFGIAELNNFSPLDPGALEISANLFDKDSRQFKPEDFIPFQGNKEDDFSSFHEQKQPNQNLPGQIILAGVSNQDSLTTNILQTDPNVAATTAETAPSTTPTTEPSLTYVPNPVEADNSAQETSGQTGDGVLLNSEELSYLGGVTCSESQDEGVNAVCKLCNADQAFFLTKANWFQVSLVHNYRTELSKVLAYAHNLFPTASWIASFGGGKICIASTTEIPSTNINLTLHYVTNGEITDYIKTNFISKDAPATVLLSGFRYVPSEQNDHVDKFILKYKVDLLVPISAMASLNFNAAWIYAAEKKAFYVGTTNLQNIQPFPFKLELTQDTNFFYAKTLVSALDRSVLDLLNGIHVSEYDQTGILKDITMTHGLQDLENFQVSTIDFKVVPADKRVEQFIIGLAYIPEFSLTPEFNIMNAQGSITMDISGSTYIPLLTINGEATDRQISRPFQVSIRKSQQEESIVFTQDESASLLKVSDLENIFKVHDSSFGGLLPAYSNFAAFNSYSLKPLEIHVKTSQIPVYYIQTKLMSDDQLNIADIEIILAGINRNITSRTKITIEDGGISAILPVGSSPLFFEQYTTDQGIDFVSCNHDLDTTQYNETFDGLYDGDRQWKHGTTVNYKFLLDKCADIAFCNVMQNMMDCSSTTLSVSGSIDSEGHLKLVSEILPHKIVLSTISFTDIVLNLDLLLGATPELSLYLTSNNQLTLEDSKTLTLDGKLLFNGTHGSLTSKTYQSWDETLGLDFIQMSGVELTGSVNPGSCFINDISAQGILLWGKSCFLLSQPDFRNATFLRERCFYGKGEVMVNVDNIQQSYLNGVYSGLSPFIILFSVLKFEDPFVFKKVSKQFLELNFTSGVEITFVPKKDTTASTATSTSPTETTGTTETTEPTETTALVEISEDSEDDETLPAGFTITGSSQLLGMDGSMKIHIDMKAQKLAATFHFPGVEVAHGNILLPEDSLQTSNNVEFRISNDYDDDTNGRGVMETKLSVLGFSGSSVFVFSNQNTTFRAVVSSDVFSNIQLSGVSYDFQHFVNGTFNVEGRVANDLTFINSFLQDMLKYWAQRVSYVIADMNQSMSDIHTMLLEKTKSQCTLDTCPKKYECQDDLVYECTKYKKKQECKKQQEYCLNTTITCQKEETACIHQVETCVTDDRSNTGECLFTTSDCKKYLSTCQLWTYTCVGPNVTTCEEFEIVDDLSECLEHSWTCKEVEIVDPNCKNECELQNKHAENLTANYNSLKSKYDLTQDSIIQLSNFVSRLNNTENAQRLNVLSFEFEELFNAPLTPQDITWRVQYKLFNETRTVEVENLGFIEEKDVVTKVMDAIGNQLATDFGFKWMTPEELRKSLHQQLELNTNPAAVFLQVFKKELK